ncbi:MAG: NERD domain-containing protein [Saprospiraceae bacterium]|uniref:NERD domain-containing protein n=1 Tax=Candidatus Opimibacter skivensis TaxID=2982028 RepID=A0A9D7XRJ1_9BACT|nr:NERD domain-containing protein [Candidatus Opimibacter skivensis]
MKILRGWFGEKITTFNMWLSLDKRTYHKFHNIILPSKNGTAQIDHLLVSVYGIFIVETKNKKGWIFGSESRSEWTQTIFKEKYSFQNPLRQTFRQKKVLSEFLELNESLIYTVVYFVGDCTFKSPLPDNVINSGLGRYIKWFQTPILSHQDVEHVIKILEEHISNSTLSKSDHIRSLHQRHTSNTVCPKCGSSLVERTVKKGPMVGSRFLGCSNYPTCRFTKSFIIGQR